MARAAINIEMLTLAAAKTLPQKKTPAASNIIGFRPQMSENLPQDGIDAALVRR